MTHRGAYFVANDAILDLAIAFLNSFRTHNPSIPLCLVPFNDDVEEVAKLSERYDFAIWADSDRLRWCDDISRQFHDRTFGHYRKLAMWDGPFDEFVYIDTDTVVLTNIDFVFEHLAEFDFITSHSGMPHIRKWVWKDSVYTTDVLTERQISYAANTGFVVSRKDYLPPAWVDAQLPAAVALAEHMELLCCEQPLLNYLAVTASRRYTSLFNIAMTTGAWHLPMERWAGDPSFTVQDGKVVQPDTPNLMMHWAGEWVKARQENRQIPYFELWDFYRRMHEPPANGQSSSTQEEKTEIDNLYLK